MNGGFSQDQLRAGAGTAPDPASVPGRGAAVRLHLLALLAGPVGAAIGLLVGWLVRRGTGPPLVEGTARAIARFHVQVVALFAAGMVLAVNGVDWGGALVLVAVGAMWTLPALAAWLTWRTARVFRYPLWDLVARRRG